MSRTAGSKLETGGIKLLCFSYPASSLLPSLFQVSRVCLGGVIIGIAFQNQLLRVGVRSWTIVESYRKPKIRKQFKMGAGTFYRTPQPSADPYSARSAKRR